MEAAEEKFETNRGWFMSLRIHFRNIKAKSEIATTDVEAAANI